MELTYSALCHSCGAPIQPNPATLCINCLKNETHLAETLDSEIVIEFCRNCEKWCTEENKFVPASLESTQLLGICLKKVKGLKGLKLTSAEFLYTEPHSRRLKIKLTVQKEILNTIVEEDHVVTYIINTTMCEDCQYTYTQHTWTYEIELRQRATHKRTFLYLESEIVKHASKLGYTEVEKESDGINFNFKQKSAAFKFIDFIHRRAPEHHEMSEKLISADIKNNTAHIKKTIFMELATISRDDLVVIPPKMRSFVGFIGPVCLVTKARNRIEFVDPITGMVGYLSSQQYFSGEFGSICSRRNRIEAEVMEVEDDGCWIETDFESETNATEFCRTHLLLEEGQTIWVYRIDQIDFSDEELKKNFEVNEKYYIISRAYNELVLRERKRKLKNEIANVADGYYNNDEIEAVAEMIEESSEGELEANEEVLEGDGYCPDVE